MSEIIDLTTGNFGYGFSDDYKQGYSDGRASIVSELEKIKNKIKNECILNELWFLDRDDLRECLGIIDAIVDKEISELKGENNG